MPVVQTLSASCFSHSIKWLGNRIFQHSEICSFVIPAAIERDLNHELLIWNNKVFMVCHLPDKNNTDVKIVAVCLLYTPTLHVGSFLFLYPPSGNSHGCGRHWSFYCPWIVSVPFIITFHFYCLFPPRHDIFLVVFSWSDIILGTMNGSPSWVSNFIDSVLWRKFVTCNNNDFMFSFVTTGEKDWHSLTWAVPVLSQKRCQGTANGNVMPWNGILTFRMLIFLLML